MIVQKLKEMQETKEQETWSEAELNALEFWNTAPGPTQMRAFLDECR